jgi:S1-C subfamily serine protease
MAEKIEWEVPPQRQPRPEEFAFDLDGALRSVVGLQSVIPDDAFTASILGTERAGSGVVIGDGGLVLTIGYLITEAESIWITGSDGRVAPGHALAYDAESGFGVVQALGRLGLPALPLGRSQAAAVGDPVVVAGAGRQQSLKATIIAKSEFAGYWEYLLDEAIFTAPAHPFWGGTGLIGPDGKLIGIGSLHVQQMTEAGTTREVNMIVPIDLLTPILDDLLAYGRVNKPARPWLGVYVAESEGKVVVADVAARGPAAIADIRRGDVVASVGDTGVADLADLYRRVWASGPAGVEIPIELVREGRSRWVRVKSADRGRFLKAPRLQ